MDWNKIEKFLEKVKADAEVMTLDEFIEKHGYWLFPMWDKYNKHPDHDEQIFEEK